MLILLKEKLYLVEADTFHTMWGSIPVSSGIERDKKLERLVKWVMAFEILPIPLFDLDDRI